MQPGYGGPAREVAFVVTVAEAVERELVELAKRDKAVAESALGASAMVLAREMDTVGNSATSKSMCARALLETMNRLNELAPEAIAGDKLDDLAKRREKRRKA